MQHWDGPHDDKIDAARYAPGFRKSVRGIGGWLLGYLTSLGVAVFVYGRAFVAALQDPGLTPFSIPVVTVGTLFLLAITSLLLMVSKHWLGVTLSKVFILCNTIVYLLVSIFLPSMIFLTIIAGAWGLVSLLYLSVSTRVRNTFQRP